ncbi:MAG: hypothetical protein HY335_05800 [Deinococcus sp.]|nr:hypothetical protein [Deinococcus sp.]
MRAVDIIRRKRDGEELSGQEIKFFVQGYTQGEVPDYQAAAWLMAIVWRGMSQREATAKVQAAYLIGPDPPQAEPLVRQVV